MSEVLKLDDYRRTEHGMYVPTTSEPTADVEPVGPGVAEQAAGEVGELATGPSSRKEGMSWWVRWTRRGAAVQQRLAEIPGKGVIRAGSRNERAAELEALAADPRAEAYANRRARFWLLAMAGLGIALGVGISSSTAQQTITSFMGWSASSVAGLAAYGADPALGLVLFATLGARILASARGVEVPKRARTALNRIELVLFSLVALLNAGPSLGHLLGALATGQWVRIGPDFMVLVIHCLGPVLVASGVFGVPYMALILAEITTATNAKRSRSPVSSDVPSPVSDLRGKRPEEAGEKPRKRSTDELRAELRGAVQAGEIDPASTQINPVKDRLGTRWQTAKDLLAEYAA